MLNFRVGFFFKLARGLICAFFSLLFFPAAKRPSSVSSLSGIVGRMMSSGERGASSSCTSVNTVCSDGERPASLSLSSSASSVSLQDSSHSSSSSSSSSLPYGAVPTYNASSSSSTPKRNGSDISLDLTPLTPHGGGGGASGGGGACVAKVTGGGGHPSNVASPVGVAAAAAVATPRQLSRLDRVVLEIVETEQAYVRDLKSIVEVRAFIQPKCSRHCSVCDRGGRTAQNDS